MLGEIKIVLDEYPEHTKSQGVQAKLEMAFLEMIDRYNISNAEAVKIAARFNSNMVRLVDDINEGEGGL